MTQIVTRSFLIRHTKDKRREAPGPLGHPEEPVCRAQAFGVCFASTLLIVKRDSTGQGRPRKTNNMLPPGDTLPLPYLPAVWRKQPKTAVKKAAETSQEPTALKNNCHGGAQATNQ